jgi:ESS family glutamate:Na+ symporter
LPVIHILVAYEATAMANMSAVTQKFGHSMKAFIVLPLVSANFFDLLNAVMIPYFLSRV